MTELKITKGLDIPIKGKPEGPLNRLEPNGKTLSSRFISLNFNPFYDCKPRLLRKAGEVVQIGEPLVEDKSMPGRLFVSPAAGVVSEVRRGLKRRLLDIVIEVSEHEEIREYDPLDLTAIKRERLLSALKERGLFPHIRQRPFDILANPEKTPRCIFVNAAATTPFAPPFDLQLEGHEEDFQAGLRALAILAEGDVHLVYPKKTASQALSQAKDVMRHSVEGPHPSGNTSVHIHMISPITHFEDVVWTLTAYDTVCIGHHLRTGRYLTERVISIAGPGVLPEKTGYFKVRRGSPIEILIAGRVRKERMRLISGDIYTGNKVESHDFLGFYDSEFCIIPENATREFLHFFRLGIDKFTASKTYLSGHLDNTGREYDFTTNLHGEKRAFVIGEPYDEVMPMKIPTMHLVKAVMAEDFDLAEQYGLLEVAPEDFGPATFVCPSKMEMVSIMQSGIRAYAAEVLE